MVIQSWTEMLINSFQNAWLGVANFVPSLIGALVVVVVGLVIASGFRALIEKISGILKIDSFIKKMGVSPVFERINVQINAGKFFGLLAYWFLTIVFVLAAVDILGLSGVSLFLRDILAYMPNIIVAVLIMLIAVALANFLKSVVRSSVTGAKLHASKFLGALAWWTTIVFGFFTALTQLGIALILNTLITGFIAMIALAGGIAFGLGGKDYAAHLLEKLRKETEDR